MRVTLVLYCRCWNLQEQLKEGAAAEADVIGEKQLKQTESGSSSSARRAVSTGLLI